MPLHESKMNDVELQPLTNSFSIDRRRRFRFYFYVPWLSVVFWTVLMCGVLMLMLAFFWSQKLNHLSQVLVRAHCTNIGNSSTAVSRCIQLYLG